MFNPKALASIIENGGMPYRQNAISYIFTCPRCAKKDKLYIRKKDGRFVCWVCQHDTSFKGRCEWALREIYSFSIKELQFKLYGAEIPDNLDELNLEFDDIWGEFGEDEILFEPPPQYICWPPDFISHYDRLFEEGFSYLTKRGISVELIKQYEIRYHPASRRVIFPLIIDGGLVGWQARAIDDVSHWDEANFKLYNGAKILTSESLRDMGHKYLMFQDNLKNTDHCVLAEGPVDALKAHKCGGNVAAMGKGVSFAQLETISSYGIKKLYLALDRDAGSDIKRILDKCSHFEIYLLLPPEGKEDLGDCTEDEVYNQYLNAPSISRGNLVFSLGHSLAF